MSETQAGVPFHEQLRAERMDSVIEGIGNSASRPPETDGERQARLERTQDIIDDDETWKKRV